MTSPIRELSPTEPLDAPQRKRQEELLDAVTRAFSQIPPSAQFNDETLARVVPPAISALKELHEFLAGQPLLTTEHTVTLGNDAAALIKLGKDLVLLTKELSTADANFTGADGELGAARNSRRDAVLQAINAQNKLLGFLPPTASAAPEQPVIPPGQSKDLAEALETVNQQISSIKQLQNAVLFVTRTALQGRTFDDRAVATTRVLREWSAALNAMTSLKADLDASNPSLGTLQEFQRHLKKKILSTNLSGHLASLEVLRTDLERASRRSGGNDGERDAALSAYRAFQNGPFRDFIEDSIQKTYNALNPSHQPTGQQSVDMDEVQTAAAQLLQLAQRPSVATVDFNPDRDGLKKKDIEWANNYVAALNAFSRDGFRTSRAPDRIPHDFHALLHIAERTAQNPNLRRLAEGTVPSPSNVLVYAADIVDGHRQQFVALDELYELAERQRMLVELERAYRTLGKLSQYEHDDLVRMPDGWEGRALQGVDLEIEKVNSHLAQLAAYSNVQFDPPGSVGMQQLADPDFQQRVLTAIGPGAWLGYRTKLEARQESLVRFITSGARANAEFSQTDQADSFESTIEAYNEAFNQPAPPTPTPQEPPVISSEMAEFNDRLRAFYAQQDEPGEAGDPQEFADLARLASTADGLAVLKEFQQRAPNTFARIVDSASSFDEAQRLTDAMGQFERSVDPPGAKTDDAHQNLGDSSQNPNRSQRTVGRATPPPEAQLSANDFDDDWDDEPEEEQRLSQRGRVKRRRAVIAGIGAGVGIGTTIVLTGGLAAPAWIAVAGGAGLGAGASALADQAGRARVFGRRKLEGAACWMADMLEDSNKRKRIRATTKRNAARGRARVQTKRARSSQHAADSGRAAISSLQEQLTNVETQLGEATLTRGKAAQLRTQQALLRARLVKHQTQLIRNAALQDLRSSRAERSQRQFEHHMMQVERTATSPTAKGAHRLRVSEEIQGGKADRLENNRLNRWDRHAEYIDRSDAHPGAYDPERASNADITAAETDRINAIRERQAFLKETSKEQDAEWKKVTPINSRRAPDPSPKPQSGQQRAA